MNEILKEFFKDSEAIYLFGSFANNTFNENSDVDIAVLFKEKKSPLEIFKLSEELSFILKRDVDLIDLASTNTAFAYEIINHSITIKKSKYAEDFENRIWWNYLTLQDDRKEILEDFIYNISKKDT